MKKNNTPADPALNEQNITSPWMFCKVMERRPDLARRILSPMLGTDHGPLTCVENETENMWNMRTGERTGVCFRAEDGTCIDLELREKYESILDAFSWHQHLQLFSVKRKHQEKVGREIGTAVAWVFLENPFEDHNDDPLVCSPITIAALEDNGKTTIARPDMMTAILNTDGNEDKAPEDLRGLILYLRKKEPCDELSSLLNEEVHRIQNDPEIIRIYDKEMEERNEFIYDNCMRMVMKMLKDHRISEKEAADILGISQKELKQRMMN